MGPKGERVTQCVNRPSCTSRTWSEIKFYGPSNAHTHQVTFLGIIKTEVQGQIVSVTRNERSRSLLPQYGTLRVLGEDKTIRPKVIELKVTI